VLQYTFVDVEQDTNGAVAVGVRADPPATAHHGVDRLDQCVRLPGQRAGEGVVAGIGLFGGTGFQTAVQAEFDSPHPKPRVRAVAPVLHGVEGVSDLVRLCEADQDQSTHPSVQRAGIMRWSFGCRPDDVDVVWVHVDVSADA
jgi:hypothetical protein